MKKKIFILSSLFILFVLVSAPASLISYFVATESSLSLNGLKGSVWSGEIKQVKVMQNVFNDVGFSVNPFSLFTANLSLDLDVAEGDIQGDVNIVMGRDYAKKLSLNDANLKVKAEILKNHLPVRGVEVAGNITTRALNVQLENRKPVSVNGLVSWKRSAITFAGQEWTLGDFVIDTSTNDKTKTITGKLLNSNNELDLKGQFTLDAKGVFEFVGDISTESERALYQAFALFNNGKPANGRLPIKFKQKIL